METDKNGGERNDSETVKIGDRTGNETKKTFQSDFFVLISEVDVFIIDSPRTALASTIVVQLLEPGQATFGIRVVADVQ